MLSFVRFVAAHVWDAETGWKSPYVSASADRKTARVQDLAATRTAYAVGRYTFDEGAVEQFALSVSQTPGLVWVGLVKRTGPPPDLSQWDELPIELTRTVFAMRGTLHVYTQSDACTRLELDERIRLRDSTTYTFTVDRQRKCVELLVNDGVYRRIRYGRMCRTSMSVRR
jgi:hypothetical protein